MNRLRGSLETTLKGIWRHRGPLAWLLRPLALVYRLITALRRWSYRAGWLASGAAGVPVLVVGNVVAGGAGKTPVVIELLRHLQARGIAAGAISRGWGRTASQTPHDVREVHADSRAADAGDEPLLIKRATGAPVFVGRHRLGAARALLARHPEVRVIVSDDGLQHWALRRDAEICVIGGSGTGNGWLLPAGPLRETGRSVTWVLDARRDADEPDRVVRALQGRFFTRRRLADHALRADGSRIALAALAGQPLHAVAAIAEPHAFFSMLRDRGLSLARCEALRDHDDFADYERPSRERLPLVCTEKDAVKLWATHPEALAVPLQLEIDRAFFAALDRWLDAHVQGGPLSSAHGRPTP